MPKASPPTLPQDLILTEILMRLPEKSIGRCRCVSKPWKRDLSTSRFAKAHFNFHEQNQPEDLIFTTYNHPQFLRAKDAERGGDAIYGQLGNFPFEGSVNVVGSCNGMVLLLSEPCQLLLINALTLEGWKVPDCPRTGVATDLYGLGFDSSAEDYKIVTISSAKKGKGNFFADIFSFKRKSWKRIDFAFSSTYVLGPGCSKGLFFNGCIHWKFSKNVGEGFSAAAVPFAFNLALEELKVVPLPQGSYFESECFEVEVVDGCLALICKLPHYCPISVWVMKDYGVKASWTSDLISVGFSYEHDILQQFVYQLNGDELVLSKNGKLQVYNWRNRVCKDMVVADAPQDLCARIYHAKSKATFKRSLISPTLSDL